MLTASRAARLAVFPLAEVSFILCAYLSQSVALKISFTLLAAAALCCSLHIVFHEMVHRGWFRGPVSSLAAGAVVTALLGSPFDEYRLSHRRHHRHTNTLDDATSTWELAPDGPRPRGFWSYTLGWPALIPVSARAILRDRRLGLVSGRAYARMIFQLALLALLHTSLIRFAPALWSIYFSAFYLGWAGIAAVNYMQHPPVGYGSGHTTSIRSALYNAVLFNNGLHAEHHARPQLPALELESKRDAATPSFLSRTSDERQTSRPIFRRRESSGLFTGGRGNFPE